MTNHQSIDVSPSSKPGHVISPNGDLLKVPKNWALLPPGDAALSRRIKKDGPSWTIKERKGRKVFSQGILAPAHRIEALKKEREQEKQDPAYQRKLDSSRARRAQQELHYKEEFRQAIYTFLDFHPDHADLAADLSGRITDHAIPVGSGTVARTKTIPIEQRAEAATIAWLRHQTTAYDSLQIPRIKGERKKIRQLLAKRSRELLQRYRQGQTHHLPTCPLYRALH